MNKILLGMAAAAALFTASSANALIKMSIDDGSGAVVITDDGALDSNALTGVIEAIYSSPDWTFETEIGVGSAQLSYPGIMDLTVVGQTNKATTLTIMLTETGLSGFGSSVLSSGGNLDGTINAGLWMDAGNNEFAMTTSLGSGSASASNPYAFSGLDTSFATDPNSPFSLTMQVVLTADGTGKFFSTDTQANVPEPSVIALFGAGLIGIGLVRRRMKK